MSEHKNAKAGQQPSRISNLSRKDLRIEADKPKMIEHLGYEVPRWLARNDADPPFPQAQHTTSQMYINGHTVDVPRSWRRGRR
jgi:hypothetical protein